MRCLSSSVSPVSLQRPFPPFAGYEDQANPHIAGNCDCNHARRIIGMMSLIRIEIANCPPYFLVRHFYRRHIGLWILHTIFLILILPPKSFGRSKVCGLIRASRLSRSLSDDGSCGTRANVYAIVVRALAACSAQPFVERAPSAPLLFPAAPPKLGLSPRSRGRRRRVAGMFFARQATTMRRILASV